MKTLSLERFHLVTLTYTQLTYYSSQNRLRFVTGREETFLDSRKELQGLSQSHIMHLVLRKHPSRTCSGAGKHRAGLGNSE